MSFHLVVIDRAGTIRNDYGASLTLDSIPAAIDPLLKP